MHRNIGNTVYKLHNQDFDITRDWLLNRNHVFTDPHFKLDDKYEWRRPFQITKDPQLYNEGTSQHDVFQGNLCNCWILCAMASLGMHPRLVKKVVPPEQSFSNKYAGIFHFHIWRFGRWYDVVVDDRLPTLNGELVSTLVYTNVFWPPLLEKAYFKLMAGEYKHDRGFTYEAMEDFTGGLVEQFSLRNVPGNFESILLNSLARHSLVACGIANYPVAGFTTPHNLVRDNTYTITAVKRVDLPKHGRIVLVRIRNPWGFFEWKGPWSDGSPEWESVPDTVREELGLVSRNYGEFWMSLSDFLNRFHWVDICYLSPDVVFDIYGQSADIGSWQLNMTRGSWVRGVMAGGAKYMHNNPQVRFTLSEADDDNNDGRCSVLVALIQKPNSGKNYLGIGFAIYRLLGSDLNQPALGKNYFENNQAVAHFSPNSIREVVGRFDLTPGSYCVIPFTQSSGKNGSFLLRIYTENKTTFVSDLDSSPKVALSPVDAVGRGAPMMETVTKGIKLDGINDPIIDYFDRVSNNSKEVDWMDLKNVLDFAVKNDIQTSNGKREYYGHFLFDIVCFIYNKIVGLSGKGNAFKKIGSKGFSYDLCRSMLALKDVDHSGKLGSNEFQDLWIEIKLWKSIYEGHSDDSARLMSSSSLRDALKAGGFNFSDRILSDLIQRYSTEENISFDDFLHCVIKLKNFVEFFKSKDKNSSMKAEFTFEEFMDRSMYS